MSQNISKSHRLLYAVLFSILSVLFAAWAGFRLGFGLMRLTGYHHIFLITAIVMVGILFQGFSDMPGHRHFNPLYRLLVWMSGIIISLLIYGLMILFVFDVVSVIIFAVTRSGLPFEIGPIISFFAALAITIYGIIHARRIHTTDYSIKLQHGASGKRIVHLSDLHLGSVITKGYMRQMVRKVNALHPDLIVITGDIINHSAVREMHNPDSIADVLAQMKAPQGVFACLGNHDPAPDDPDLMRLLGRAHITLLDNRMVSLTDLDLAGRNGNSIDGRPPIKDWLPKRDESRPLVMLDHYPNGMDDAVEMGADLVLCGHTHKGQYFPCNLLLWRTYPGKLCYGLSTFGKSYGIVSSGTGYFQIPIRVGTISEIVCIDLL